MKTRVNLSFFKANTSNNLERPLFTQSVQAGFPSPADDHIDKKLDLNEFLIENPSATFFVKVEGHSMKNAGIFHEDILIVDRSKTATSDQIVLAILNGEFTVKRISISGKNVYLVPENPEFSPLMIKEGDDFEVWGVVTYIIHKAK